jgi:hypothetical protein
MGPNIKLYPLKKTQSLKLFTGLLAMNLMLAAPSSSFASGHNKHVAYPPATFGDSGSMHHIQVNRSQFSKKYKIGLYPDASQEVLFFSAGGAENKVYQLYLFDMDGKLTNQATIRNRETTVLTHISGGNYLFEVFSNDERIGNGQLVVK